MGIRRTVLYGLLAAYRKRPQTTTLVPKDRGRRPETRVLEAKAEAMIATAIKEDYLVRERPRFSDFMLSLGARYHAVGIKVPDARTVRRRIEQLDPRNVTAARFGGKRSREIYGPALAQPQPLVPLSMFQMDHSPVDVMGVDETSRLAIGRPWLTLAIDVATRIIAGFYLSFDPPSALSVALALTHAVLPKESWLLERKIDLPWPVCGIPDRIETDNAEEFHSKAFERGAGEYGIKIGYRLPGSPQTGGHIERLIGTFMHRIHLIPGTTFSNVAQKGDYDSEKRAVMTLKEIERWLTLEILGVYHKSVHSALRQPPEHVWKERISIKPEPVRHPRDPGRFLLDFLPGEYRMIRRDGIQLLNLHYWDNVLSPMAGRSKSPFLVKYDPRDLSRVFLWDAKGDYWTIPYRDLGAPPITLWEHRNALRKLRAEGVRMVDEKLIFQTVTEQRAIVAEAKRKTRAQRLIHARSGANIGQPADPPPAPADVVSDPKTLPPFPVEEWS